MKQEFRFNRELQDGHFEEIERRLETYLRWQIGAFAYFDETEKAIFPGDVSFADDGVTMLAAKANVAIASSTGILLVGDVAGQHLALDGNELQAKASATTVGNLFINYKGGGQVHIGTPGSSGVTVELYGDEVRMVDHATTASAANMFINSTTGRILRSTASSRRYKQDIEDLPDADSLLNVQVRQFRFKDGYLATDDPRDGEMVPGFIAEELQSVEPRLVDNEDGVVESWNDRILLPMLLKLVQDQDARIVLLEAQVAAIL